MELFFCAKLLQNIYLYGIITIHKITKVFLSAGKRAGKSIETGEKMRNIQEKSKAGRRKILRIIDVAAVVVVVVTLFLMFSVATSADMSSARALPHTGGRGRIAIYASGSAIVTGCVVYGLTSLRMRKRRDDDRFEDEFDADDDNGDGNDTDTDRK